MKSLRSGPVLFVAALVCVAACGSEATSNPNGPGSAQGGSTSSGAATGGSGGSSRASGSTASSSGTGGGSTGIAGGSSGAGSTGSSGQSLGSTASSASSAGSSGSGASASSSSSGGGDDAGAGLYPLNNPPVKSAGCGKAAPSAVTPNMDVQQAITSSGQARKYFINIPSGYDMNKPYRFFYCSHWIGARAEDVVGQHYYWLKDQAQMANEPAIFLAPQALPGSPTVSGGGTWSTNSDIDQVLFDDLLAYVKENFCIDTSRVFATGFSFGGMMTYSLSVNRQKDIRAAVGIAPANYNIYYSQAEKTHQPIGWMQTTGMSDTTCPWVNGSSTTQGSKYIGIEHGTDDGCTVPNPIPTWTQGPHLCVDFQGCKAGYPTKVCTFNGPHTNINSDPGTNANWIPVESWKFFSQY